VNTAPRTVFTKLYYLYSTISKSITLLFGWKCFQGTNALAYLSHSEVTKKKKCCEYGPRHLFLFLFFLPPAKKENPMKILRRPQPDPIKLFTIVSQALPAKKLERSSLLFIPILVEHLWVRIDVSFRVETLSRLMLHSEGWLLDMSTNI
jgi:hypothetical protein